MGTLFGTLFGTVLNRAPVVLAVAVVAVVHLDGAEVDAEAPVVPNPPRSHIHRRARRPVQAAAATGRTVTAAAAVIPVPLKKIIIMQASVVETLQYN